MWLTCNSLVGFENRNYALMLDVIFICQPVLHQGLVRIFKFLITLSYGLTEINILYFLFLHMYIYKCSI